VQVARALRIEISNVHVTVAARYARQGSILGGDISSRCTGVKTQVSLDASEPARIGELIRLAEGSCFTMAALRDQTPVELEATVNGSEYSLGKD
jgi:organic hydroperoxide reductase OsmC/OhrA